MTRCIYTDPRAGDRVQVHPVICDRLPEPLVVTSVDEHRIGWNRPVAGQSGSCSWHVWQTTGASAGGPGKALELLEPVATRDEEQFDMFGESVA